MSGGQCGQRARWGLASVQVPFSVLCRRPIIRLAGLHRTQSETRIWLMNGVWWSEGRSAGTQTLAECEANNVCSYYRLVCYDSFHHNTSHHSEYWPVKDPYQRSSDI